MSEAVQWRVEDNGSQVTAGPLEGQVESDSSLTRFRLRSWRGKAADRFSVLATGAPMGNLLKLRERYARGADLVEDYETIPVIVADAMSPQFYWRVAVHDDLAAVQVQLIVSLRTELLDSDPESSVYSCAWDASAFHAASLAVDQFEEIPRQPVESSFDRVASAENLFVLRDESCGLSYAEMIHPSDFVRARLLKEGRPPWMLDSTLFPERLEKGVIRRGRICGWFLPAENDLEVAVELAKRFVDEPLPLTA
jgi:hypothetical protein